MKLDNDALICLLGWSNLNIIQLRPQEEILWISVIKASPFFCQLNSPQALLDLYQQSKSD